MYAYVYEKERENKKERKREIMGHSICVGSEDNFPRSVLYFYHVVSEIELKSSAMTASVFTH